MLQLYISQVCEDCFFIEEQLPHFKEHVEVWDVKVDLRRPGIYVCQSRDTGVKERVQLLAIPLLVEEENGEMSKAFVGSKHIVERLGGANRIIIAH